MIYFMNCVIVLMFIDIKSNQVKYRINYFNLKSSLFRRLLKSLIIIKII